MKQARRCAAMLLAGAMVLGASPALAAGEEVLTRGEAAGRLLEAA